MNKEDGNKIQDEFFVQLGKLSVKFAKLELNIIELIVIITNSDDEIISRALVEKNSISQNIERLRKIVPLRFMGEELSTIEKLLNKIDEIRKIRNLFIHGDWGMPTTMGTIICDERKVKFPKKNNTDQTYSLNTLHEFSLDEIKNKIIEIDGILSQQDEINLRLFNDNFL